MIPEEMQRAIQFLLDNQAGHDARLAKIEVAVDRLTGVVDSLTGVTSTLAVNQQELANTQREMQAEFREGLERILTVSEQTMASVRQVAEAEARTIRRVNVLEDRVDAIENSGK